MADWARIMESTRAVVAAARAAECARFLADWPAPVATRPVAPATLAVLRWLGDAARDAPAGPLGALARQIAGAATELAWRQTYRAGEVPASFLERYGWCELAGSGGPVASAALGCGLLLLGPDTHYPPHSHAAEELYVPLSGAAEWQRGPERFAVRQPGDSVFHASGAVHAMRTGAAPLLALYLWRGDGLGDAARLVRQAPRPKPSDRA
jgi:mannose-6-phosphate isomerase-like protein (cupin superfamily)